MNEKQAIYELLNRNKNHWVRVDKLAAISTSWEQKIAILEHEGNKFETRQVADGNGTAEQIRLVVIRDAANGEWRCTYCYVNVTKGLADGFKRTLHDSIREGYCPDCKKKRLFQPA